MTTAGDGSRTLEAGRCPDGHLTCPPHRRCPACGSPQEAVVDLRSKTGTVVTWTTVTSTPPGVREPNTLAVVEFSLEAGAVRVLGGTTDDVDVGDDVRPVSVDQLRDPERSVRTGTDQPWGGFRFDPL